MGAEALKGLIKKSGIKAEEIDLIICATVTPDMLFPSTACLIADKVGANKAFGFDLSAACSAFLFALDCGQKYISSGLYKKVVVIGADKMSSIVDYSDRKTCVIFGDGAGAVLLEPTSINEGLIDSVLRVDGSGSEYLKMIAGGSLNPASQETVKNGHHYIYQDGKTVFKFAVTNMADVSDEIMKRNNLKGEDVDWLVPHQANLRIIDATARRMELDSSKVMINIHKYGNTTAASIGIALSEAIDEGADFLMLPMINSLKEIESFCSIVNNKVPINMSYELFLDQNGEKISKSKGNGLSIDEWMTYGTKESLSLFMYQNPRRAKRLYFDCIPKSMDDYKKYFKDVKEKKQELFESPIWHIHEGAMPENTYPIEFSTLINLVTALNTSDIPTIKNFCLLYIKNSLDSIEQNYLEEVIKLAVKYFQNFILPKLKKRKPSTKEKEIIENIINDISNNKEEISAEEYQNLIYKYGKVIYPENLRDWFISLYQILFGSDNGPRLGSLFYLYKKNKVLQILQEAIK